MVPASYRGCYFGSDDDGEYMPASGWTLSSVVHRILPYHGKMLQLPGQGGNQIDWTLHEGIGIDVFEVQRSIQSDFADFTVVTTVTPEEDEISYLYTDPYIIPQTVYYRIAAKMQDSSVEYSPIRRILGDPVSKPTLIYQPKDNTWRVSLPDPWQNGDVSLYDIQGKEIFTRKLNADSMSI